VLGNVLCGERHESESTRLASEDVLQDYCVLNIAELHEVVLQLFAGQLEIETTNKDL